jgi:hypothetical protein
MFAAGIPPALNAQVFTGSLKGRPQGYSLATKTRQLQFPTRRYIPPSLGGSETIEAYAARLFERSRSGHRERTIRPAGPQYNRAIFGRPAFELERAVYKQWTYTAKVESREPTTITVF